MIDRLKDFQGKVNMEDSIVSNMTSPEEKSYNQNKLEEFLRIKKDLEAEFEETQIILQQLLPKIKQVQ